MGCWCSKLENIQISDSNHHQPTWIQNNRSKFNKKKLSILMSNTIEKIKRIREADFNAQNKLSLGRELALYSQLYINALLASEHLRDK